MRAAVVYAPGEPPTYGEHPSPTPQRGRSVVRVMAAPVVPLDLLCASGTSYFGAPSTPYVPGVQGVGVVERSLVHPAGTRVWFATSAGMAPGDGSLAELCGAADDDLIPVGPGLSDAALAALGLSAVAAWMSLTWRAHVRPGEAVLVLGAGGAVGQTAVGAAQVLGARRVVAVCRSAEARSRALEAGADDVVEMTSDPDELTRRLEAACHGGVDVVVDPVFGPAATAASRVLADRGRLVNIGSAGGADAAFSSAVLRSRSAEILGYTNNALTGDQRRDALLAVVGHAEAGRLAVAHTCLPLSQVEEAWRATGAGEPGLRHILRP